MDREAWRAAVHGVTKSRKRLSDWTELNWTRSLNLWFGFYFPWKVMDAYYKHYAAAAAKSLQSCLTLCDPIDGSPLGSSVPGVLQARILEWVAISFSHAWKWKVKVNSLSRAWLSATPCTAAYQAPPSMGFSRQEYWSGLPLPSPYKHYSCYLNNNF